MNAVEKLDALAAKRDQQRNRVWPVYTLANVAEHNHKDDCWIVVNDKVYDMTPHVQNHEGWMGSGKVSTLLAILSAMGTDCTEDFNKTHDARGFRELNAYQVLTSCILVWSRQAAPTHNFVLIPSHNHTRVVLAPDWNPQSAKHQQVAYRLFHLGRACRFRSSL
jgi:hypothetical protein